MLEPNYTLITGLLDSRTTPARETLLRENSLEKRGVFQHEGDDYHRFWVLNYMLQDRLRADSTFPRHFDHMLPMMSTKTEAFILQCTA